MKKRTSFSSAFLAVLFAVLFCVVLGGSAALFTVFTAEIAPATRTPGYADLTARFGAPVDPDEARRWVELGETARKGPEALLNRIREDKTPAPLIHSRWYVDERIAKEFPDAVETENAIREFGRAWLVQLEEESRTLRALTTNEEREAKAWTLLNLADWIGSAGGYGNVWLFFRLQDLANIPVGYLLSDNEYPMASLEQLVPRLRDYIGIFTSIGIPALNSEAPEPVFKLGEVKPDPKFGPPRSKSERALDIQTPALSVWGKKHNEAVNSLRKTQKEGEYVGDLTGAEKRSRLPENLQFFTDDSDDNGFDAKPFTALAHWDDKFHYKILLGLVGSNIKYSFALLEFRRKVGNIPGPYVFTHEEIAQGEKNKEDSAKKGGKVVLYWDNPNFDAQEFAFRKAWWTLSDIPEENRNLYLDAYRLIKLVRENKLWDDDYQKKLLYNEKSEWSIHVKKQQQRSEEREKQDREDPVYLKYTAARTMWKDAIENTNRIEKKVLELMKNAGASQPEPPLDAHYLFLLRDEKYDEAEAYFEKRKRNALGRLPNRDDLVRQLEALLIQESEAFQKQVEQERAYSKAKKEYEAYKAELDKQRKIEDQKETEDFFKRRNIH